MLNKLIKYEFKAILKYLVFVLPVSLLSGIVFSLMVRNADFSVFLSTDFLLTDILYQMLYSSSIMAFILSISASYFIVLAVLVIRYYKELFSNQGYLTFTLPVNNTHHYLCRLLVGGVINIAITLYVVLVVEICGYIAISDSLILTAIDFIINDLNIGFEQYLSLFLYFIALLTAAFTEINTCFTCVSIGQQFKHRIIASVVSYIIYYTAVQIFAMIVTVISFSASYNISSDFIQTLLFYITPIVAIVFNIAYNVGLSFLNRHFITNKLNLE